MNSKTQPKVFIISWTGKHQNALLIAHEFLRVTNEVAIVYSDSDPKQTLNAKCKLIRRPDSYFWEDKFNTCINDCNDQHILVIHADCECTDWLMLYKRYCETLNEYRNLGVWAPRIFGTHYELSATSIARISDTTLHISAITDGIVFGLCPSVIARMKKVTYGRNLYGWGIDLLFCAYAHLNNMLVLIDESVNVVHPRSRGYEFSSAFQQMQRFLNEQLTIQERVQVTLLNTWVNRYSISAHKHLAKLKSG